MPSVRRKQVQDLRQRNRMLVLGPWFTPKWRPVEMQPAEREKRMKSAFKSLQKKNPNVFSVAIRRMGRIERRSTREKRNVLLPFGETEFSEWYDFRHSKTHARRVAGKHPGRFSASPYNLGANAIIELVDSNGRPSHIVMIKRPKSVPEAPGYYDFAAGLVRKGQSPAEMLKRKIAQETGIPAKSLSILGPDFKKSADGGAFAMHLNEKVANYNVVFVVRAQATPKQFREMAKRAKKDVWAAERVAVIRRTPEAIREFLGRKRKVWMPEVLRLYARELYLQGKAGRKP